MHDKTADRIQIALIAAMAVAGVCAWAALPDGAQVPVHFNASGEADRWASAPLGLMAMPAMALFMLATKRLLPKVEPRQENLQRSADAVDTIFLAVALLFTALQAYIIALALGWEQPMPRLVLVLVGTLLMVVGNVMGKVRPNYFVGIRTPWTLSSDHVWDQTHRFGGKAFVLAGLALLLLPLTPLPLAWQGYAVAVVSLLAAGAAVLKSYLLWRDQQRQA